MSEIHYFECDKCKKTCRAVNNSPEWNDWMEVNKKHLCPNCFENYEKLKEGFFK